MELKEIIAKNLTELRKQSKLSQAELAEKMNYTDKAVSKWENGYAAPALETLYDLSKLYGVSVDFILTTHDGEEIKPTPVVLKQRRIKDRNHCIISLLSVLCVWLIATIIFVCLNSFASINGWISFIWAFPASFIVAIVFNEIWGKRHLRMYFVSLLLWSLLASIYLQIMFPFGFNMWMIFLVGIPLEVGMILWDLMEIKNNK